MEQNQHFLCKGTVDGGAGSLLCLMPFFCHGEGPATFFPLMLVLCWPKAHFMNYRLLLLCQYHVSTIWATAPRTQSYMFCIYIFFPFVKIVQNDLETNRSANNCQFSGSGNFWARMLAQQRFPQPGHYFLSIPTGCTPTLSLLGSLASCINSHSCPGWQLTFVLGDFRAEGPYFYWS